MVFLITRPLPQAKKTAAKLEKMGIKTLIEPCIRIEPTQLNKRLRVKKSIVIVTSRNGARAFAGNCDDKSSRIITVGSRAADFLKQEGFAGVLHSARNAKALLDYIKSNFAPGADKFLYIRGRHAAADLKSSLKGYLVRDLFLYESVAATGFSANLAGLAADGEITGLLLYSARTAEVFMELAEKAGISKFLDKMVIFCLSPSLAEVCRAIPHKEILAAARPNEDSLLELVKKYVDNSR